jgi:hypothetical protein
MPMIRLRASGFGALLFTLVCMLEACGGDDDAPDDPHGRACGADSECDSLHCRADLDATPEDLAQLPLICGDAQKGAAAGAECESGRDCALGICLLAGACAAPCAEDGDCAKSDRCQSAFARSGSDALQTLSACVARSDVPRGVSVESDTRPDAIDIGDNDVDLDPADEAGQTLYVLEHSRNNWPDGVRCRTPLCMRTLYTRDETPRLLFDTAADYMQDMPQNPVAIGDHIDPLVIAFPSGDRSVLSDAGYRATVTAEQAGDLRVTRLSASHEGGVLDLNVFYVGALDWTPNGARGPALLADALDVVDEIFAQADISIGVVRQIAVPGGLAMRGVAFPDGDAAQGFGVLQVRRGVYMELPSLFRLSAGAGNSAVNLFFVRDIEPRNADGEPEAEAGGIPGPLGMHGTGGSGIAIATDMMAGDPMRLGRTLAHEIAHYLGLFHTSEADGSVFDALADTAECRSDRDVDRDGLSVADCEDAGADNLMFWALTTGTKLSATQQSVLRAALILQ